MDGRVWSSTGPQRGCVQGQTSNKRLGLLMKSMEVLTQAATEDDRTLLKDVLCRASMTSPL